MISSDLILGISPSRWSALEYRTITFVSKFALNSNLIRTFDPVFVSHRNITGRGRRTKTKETWMASSASLFWIFMLWCYSLRALSTRTKTVLMKYFFSFSLFSGNFRLTTCVIHTTARTNICCSDYIELCFSMNRWVHEKLRPRSSRKRLRCKPYEEKIRRKRSCCEFLSSDSLFSERYCLCSVFFFTTIGILKPTETEFLHVLK